MPESDLIETIGKFPRGRDAGITITQRIS